MTFVQERKKKGKTYVYLSKSARIGKRAFKASKYLGPKDMISEKRIKDEIKKFSLESDKRMLDASVLQIKKRYLFKYPFTIEEAIKIEEMNLKYIQIKASLSKKDWEDAKKRFVANFVFESNALEGNSLTLKNFSEIVFENKIAGSTDLREVYDAKNSYLVFSKLFSSKKEISEQFIITLHKAIMRNIDDRTGYKKVPNILLGKRIELTPPKEVGKAMKELILWYYDSRRKIHPLELAFLFHHRFERIHPFADGNGRVGRMLLNYVLIKEGYYPIIIRKTHRNSYLKTLEAADNRQNIPLMRFALENAKETYRKFFEVYYMHI